MIFQITDLMLVAIYNISYTLHYTSRRLTFIKPGKSDIIKVIFMSKYNRDHHVDVFMNIVAKRITPVHSNMVYWFSIRSREKRIVGNVVVVTWGNVSYS